MNKLFIVLMAVCLFSVVSSHAFVKRDAPPTVDITAQLAALKDQATGIVAEVNKNIAEYANPDMIQNKLKELIDIATKTLENLNPTPAPIAGDAKPAA